MADDVAGGHPGRWYPTHGPPEGAHYVCQVRLTTFARGYGGQEAGHYVRSAYDARVRMRRLCGAEGALADQQPRRVWQELANHQIVVGERACQPRWLERLDPALLVLDGCGLRTDRLGVALRIGRERSERRTDDAAELIPQVGEVVAQELVDLGIRVGVEVLLHHRHDLLEEMMTVAMRR